MADNQNVNPGDPGSTDEEAIAQDFANIDADAAAEALIDEASEEDSAAAAAAEADAVADEAAQSVSEETREAEEAAMENGATANPEEALSKELAERTEDLQRVTAEYTNYRRRVERDRASVIAGARADIAAQLLPIVDDLDLAESHGDLTGPLKAMADKLQGVLNSVKVEAFGVEGEEFNPELHEAVQDTSTGDDKVVGTVLRKGYRAEDRVLRHAMIILADPQ
ncbi:nucleotide exchange factor GrpE [Corynebacterium auriscanis]|uniref:nucleotide exchange factor GrpE n=1 Tax=Corynebacterium auriscanis TaxID=99807 RepID=UPI002246B74E|nr:nucleotide exchange factor GrpE [Corynebacterium auriscanis]MCX2163857.1 nucleotide exchange factor GrpE [Corynebacterium auriscanis]